MTAHIEANRRSLLAAAFGVAVAASDAIADDAIDFAAELTPNADFDQSAAMQAAVDRAAANGVPLALAPGVYRVADIRLRAGTRLLGAARATVLSFIGGPAFVTADKADGLIIRGVTLDAAWKALDASRGEGALSVTRCNGVALDDIEVRQSSGIGVALANCSGRIAGSTITDALSAGIKALDSAGLDIRDNVVSACGDNGVLVWRSTKSDDGSTVIGNRIASIRNASGGTGEYGNGVNVFRAGGVQVANNRIVDCAYSAVRGNAADNIQIVANSCERLGEVALYAEFGFEGALIANNVVDTAATGISVTNFNDGGRLAVIQGNLIRNLFRREREDIDKRGEGIGVEADAVVTGNVIEGAPTVGIQVGWGTYMRDVVVTSNVVRRAKIGVSVTADADSAACLIANNVMSGVQDGAIRQMRHGTPFGPDLAANAASPKGLTIAGNVVSA